MDTGMVFPTKTNGQKIHPWISQKLVAPPKGKLARTKTICKWNQWKTNGITTQELSTHTPANPSQYPQVSLTNKWNPTSATNWKTTPATNTTDTTHSDSRKGKQQQQRKQWKWHIRTIQKVKPKQATTNTITRLTRQTRKDNPKDSHMSIKWQPQERLKIQRTGTRQHLDSYLALAEVRCEWNVDTFCPVLQRCIRCGAGDTRYARLV